MTSNLDLVDTAILHQSLFVYQNLLGLCIAIPGSFTTRMAVEIQEKVAEIELVLKNRGINTHANGHAPGA